MSVLYLYKLKNKMKYLHLIIIASVAITSCSTPEKAEIEVIKIDSKAVLDSLNKISDTTFLDTANYSRRPKAQLFIQIEENLKHQVFSDSLGNILTHIIYKDTIVEFVEKYFSNGQIISKVNYNENDEAHGEYKFYFPNGQIKIKGEYINGEEVTEKRVMYSKEGYKIEKP